MRLAALLAALLILAPAAWAEGAAGALTERLPLEQLQALSDEFGGPDVRAFLEEVMSGEASASDYSPGRALRMLASALRSALVQTLAALAPPVIASFAAGLVLPGRRSAALSMLCRAGCACALVRGFSQAMGHALRVAQTAGRISEAVSPVLSAVLSIAGSKASAAALSPLSALCAGIVERVIVEIGLPLCALAAIVGTAGNLSESFRLERLAALLKQAAAWGAGLLMTAFVGLMAVEGRLAAAQDAVSVRAVQQSVRGLLPVIGGQVSDSVSALAGSIALLRNAVGLTGVLLAACACLRPIVSLSAYMLSIKLAAAAAEPVADPGILRIVSGFSDAAEMLLVMAVGSAVPVIMLIGAASGLLNL